MILLLFLLIVFSVVSYKKSVLFTAATFMFMGNLSSGIEGVKLFYLIAVVQIFLFYVLGANKRNCDSYPLLILIPTLMAGLCYFVSSAIGVISNYAKNVVNIAAWFYYPYIVWHVMSTKKDVKLYGKILVSFYVIVVLYTFVELALGQNVFAIWAESAEIIEGELGGVESGERFGLLRCNSILPYSSALGMNSSLIFLIIVVLKVKLQKDLPFQKILFYLLPICVLLSGTRSQFVVFAICVLGILLSKEYRRTKEIKTFIIVSIVIIYCCPIKLPFNSITV